MRRRGARRGWVGGGEERRQKPHPARLAALRALNQALAECGGAPVTLEQVAGLTAGQIVFEAIRVRKEQDPAPELWRVMRKG